MLSYARREKTMYEFLDFYADWCGPCHAMHPIIEEAEKEFLGKVKFSKIDIDKNQTLAEKYGVMSIPTYIIVKDGVEVERKVGMMLKDSLKKWIGTFAK